MKKNEKTVFKRIREIVITVNGIARTCAVSNVVIYRKRYSKHPLKKDNCIKFFVNCPANKNDENQPEERYIKIPDKL